MHTGLIPTATLILYIVSHHLRRVRISLQETVEKLMYVSVWLFVLLKPDSSSVDITEAVAALDILLVSGGSRSTLFLWFPGSFSLANLGSTKVMAWI